MDELRARSIVSSAWSTYAGGGTSPEEIELVRTPVSTNRVYRLTFAARPAVFAKVSSYGSFVHFRQDHQRIEEWRRLLLATPFSALLAPVLSTDEDVYTFHAGDAWAVFYGEVERGEGLPARLDDHQCGVLAREMARLHHVCQSVSSGLAPTWKSVGSDVAIVFDGLSRQDFRVDRGLTEGEAKYLRDHCNLFLRNADRLGYANFPMLPVLVDWNIGNFSVRARNGGFELFRRWDYDWFRIAPRMLDFYFFARVVSDAGDKTAFSYLPDPLFEPRFRAFLSEYDSQCPLSNRDILFLKEAYRFFILNYVVGLGEHFFEPGLRARLLRETVDLYLPVLERMDFEELVASVVEGRPKALGLLG